MKKLLIVLMVVAMASFLFVGCIPTTPDDDDEEPDPTPPPTTVAPVITSVPDISGGYINKDAAADGIVVNGTAPTYSEVKVYINGLTAGTGDAGFNGVFSVVVANADLIKAVKVDGAKTLYATATEAGLAESASSNVKTFTLDTVAPKISSSKAKSGTAPTPLVPATATATPAIPGPTNALDGLGLVTPTLANVVSGTWIIAIHNVTNTIGNVSVTHDGITTFYDNFLDGAILAPDVIIPGVGFTLNTPILQGQLNTIVCVAQVAAVTAVPGYINITFNEPVTSTSILAGTWEAFAATTDIEPVVTVRGTDLARLTEDAATLPNLVAGVAYSVSVSGISDLAGNSIPDSSPSTDTGVVIL